MNKIQPRNPQYFHKEMWLWLARNPGKEKYNWPRWQTYLQFQHHDCFACAFALEKFNAFLDYISFIHEMEIRHRINDESCNAHCFFCPITPWRKTVQQQLKACFAPEELFYQWDVTYVPQFKANIAREIAHLEWSYDFDLSIKWFKSCER